MLDFIQEKMVAKRILVNPNQVKFGLKMELGIVTV